MLTSLYIHIPFCNQICTYCDFHKEVARDDKKRKYIDALIKELRFNKEEYTTLQTVFIGGGTPSSLDLDLLEELLQEISQNIDLGNIIEYSIETNPNDITDDFVRLITKYGINRVSVGVQTFHQKHLEFLGRTHTVHDIQNALKTLRKFNIKNISIDMIFSLIDQTMDELNDDLNEVLKLDIDHISYYSLILEEKTKLHYLYEHKKISMNSEDLEGLMYNKVIDTLTQNGYTHYEISNFKKPGKSSLHNLTYWRNKEYLGIGSGAHSMYSKTRFFNPLNVTKYIDIINNDIRKLKTSYEYDELNEEMMLGLRLMKGVAIEEINTKYQISLFETYPDLQKFIENGILEIVNNKIRFTRNGILLGNEVFRLFVEVSRC